MRTCEMHHRSSLSGFRAQYSSQVCFSERDFQFNPTTARSSHTSFPHRSVLSRSRAKKARKACELGFGVEAVKNNYGVSRPHQRTNATWLSSFRLHFLSRHDHATSIEWNACPKTFLVAIPGHTVS